MEPCCIRPVRSPEENEQSIEYLLSLDDTLELVEVPKYPGFCNGNPAWGKTENAELKKCARLWPHHIEGEGHFVALIHKKEAEQTQVFQSWIHRGCKPDKNAERIPCAHFIGCRDPVCIY